ncbi:DEAD/DEAH box helicase, partial [Candidatus Saccharibacteria bacterium]|nr:DEAD/DEAH box helicase [Candidatus Saccharibacteria bacterium]
GDVGSGKTAVAAIAIVNAAASGYQSALMAPTEILASQHAKTLYNLLPLRVREKIVFLSGSLSPSQKKNALSAISSGDAKVVIGTHAIIQEHVVFDNLGLAVIDEQHRFGVEQRKALQGKAREMPHILNMTATPIPRSIALTLYGEMDVSLLQEKPKNRQVVSTKIVQPEERQKLYESLSGVISEKRQAFVVCPLIEDDEKPGRGLSVAHIARQIASWIPNARVEILHGKMKADKKEDLMQRFVNREVDILVSTTVIEVGVDVPNATHMIIEGADRFGLAQLHQLRGRVGRGELSGNCVLILTDNGATSRRLQFIEQESDGFKLAEYDLELRGPGAIYGTMQHGALDLRVAKITDVKLIAEARQAARDYIKKGENLLQYPQLKAKVDRLRTVTNLN